MSAVSNAALAFSMSADAFAASIGKGSVLRNPRLSQAMRIGFIFGAVKTLTPLLGWLAGRAASHFIESVDHWIAFTILALIGGKMILDGWRKEEEERPSPHKLHLLLLTAFATSIDAMAVGASLALINSDILLISLMIGSATFLMSTIGIMTGHYLV